MTSHVHVAVHVAILTSLVSRTLLVSKYDSLTYQEAVSNVSWLTSLQRPSDRVSAWLVALCRAKGGRSMCFFVRRGAIRIGWTSQGYRKSGYVAKGRLTIDIKPTVLQVVTYTLDQVRWVVHDKYLAIVVTEEWVVDGDTK